jgi:hypothetical protein
MNNKFQLIISGGGFSGYHNVGFSYMLNKYINKENLMGITGTSAGASTAVYIACNIDIGTWTYSYHLCKEKFKEGLDILEAVKFVNNHILPVNAHELCNKHNVELVATKVSIFGLETVIFKNFKSRDELLNCLSASICLPFIANSVFPYCVKIKNEYYIDGAILLNTPIKKICDYDQLVLRNHYVPYNLKYRFRPSDPYIESLILQGVIDFNNLIKGNLGNVFRIYKKNTVCIPSRQKYVINLLKTIIVFYSVKYINNTFIKFDYKSFINFIPKINIYKLIT